MTHDLLTTHLLHVESSLHERVHEPLSPRLLLEGPLLTGGERPVEGLLPLLATPAGGADGVLVHQYVVHSPATVPEEGGGFLVVVGVGRAGVTQAPTAAPAVGVPVLWAVWGERLITDGGDR